MLYDNNMLEEFGLTKTEENVYLALLRTGESNAASIIKRTQLHRTTIYDVLDRLIEKGFVSYIIKNKIKWYSPAKPSKFLDIASEDKKKAEEKHRLAIKVIEKIKDIEKINENKTNAQIFVGLKGQKTIMNDIIETGKDFYIFGSEGRAEDSLPLYTEKWANQRRSKKIHAKIIATRGSNAPLWTLNEIRYVPKEYQSPATTMIYGDKVALFVQDNPVLIILIESKMLAKSYISYFNLLWKIAKK